MADRFVKASGFFNKFLKFTLGSYLRVLFDLKIYKDGINGLKPPYIVLANHTNFWDPFLLSLCFSNPIYFVTSDTHFRSRILKNLLKLVGAIPKTKFVSDPSATRDIFKVVKIGGIIGIFPEGRRSWDGKTLPLIYPTAKLIKSLGLPVVTVVFKGANLAMPRWAKSSRKGEVNMHCELLLNKEAIEKMTVEDIFNSISSSLAHDEYEWQKSRMTPYKGKSPAERLELFLFCCPHCKAIGTMASNDDAFFCKKCGYSVTYDKYGFFTKQQGKSYFDNPRDWNLWQLDYTGSLPGLYADNNIEGPIFEDKDVLAQTGGRLITLKRLQTGKLYMYANRIVFHGDEGLELEFPIRKLYGENIQSNRQLEFYYEKVLYRFTGNTYCLSAYKWVKAIDIFKKIEKGANNFE